MNRVSCIRLISTVFFGLSLRVLPAQSSGESAPNSSTKSADVVSAISAVDSTSTSNSEGVKETQYTPALDGTGLIAMDRAMPKHFIVGASVSGGWDSNPNNLTYGVSSGLYTLSPYFGIQANSPKTQFLLQYQPTITGYTSSSYSNQTMQAASAAILGNVNERWTWNINASGNYGQNSTRFLAPQQNVTVGEVPGTGPSSASYLQDEGTVTYATGSTELHYKKSERDSIKLGVANTFSRYSGLSDNNSIATASIGYDRALSSSFEIRAYGQNYVYYGTTNCMSVGGGAGIKWHVLDGTLFSLTGGPQFNTSACGKQQILFYNAAFSTRLTNKSQIYLLAAREPAISYLGPGLWQSSASGGYQRKIMTTGTLRLDAGYASSNTITAVNSYHGTYFDCLYSVQLGHGVGVTYSYRGYIGDTGGNSFTRNVALFSLSWTPGAGHIFQ